MAYYEETLVLPNMRMWLPETATLSRGLHESITQASGQDTLFDERSDPQVQNRDEEKAWANEQHSDDNMEVGKFIERFRSARASQLVILAHFDEQAWDTSRNVTWGNVTLRWVVTKTFQHTAEHTNDILKMALFWR